MLSLTTSATAPTIGRGTTSATNESATPTRSFDAGLWDSLRGQELQWLPEYGVGFLAPLEDFVYDDAYFEHYEAMAATDLGLRLTTVRLQMLRRHLPPRKAATVVDIGIGAGIFVATARAAGVPVRGFDVNPRGIAWLCERDLFHDPRAAAVDVACLWDTLEHIANPAALLANVRRAVLVSLPIFRDADHARQSKHYKPGEHLWYFTDRGLHWFMAQHGFACIEQNIDETLLGREDIGSYVFLRR